MRASGRGLDKAQRLLFLQGPAREDVIPRSDIKVDATLPPSATYWVPSDEELDTEEGFGFFCDTWVISGRTRSEALAMADTEMTLVELADDLTADAETFEDVLRAFEGDEPDFLPEDLRAGPAWARLSEYFVGDGVSPVDGLDLGVASLVCALSAIGCFPAASCRGHGGHGWSPYPVVYAALSSDQAATLQPLVARSGCGFGIDPERSEFMIVLAPSVTETLDLARSIAAQLPAE